MKLKLILLFNIFLTLLFSCTGTGIEIHKLLNSMNFKNFSFDKSYIPSAYELSAIHFILKNTYENNIHKMRGETKNEVYVSSNRNKHGYSEAVFDENKQHVTNSYNKASFNYFFHKTEPIKHFGYDMLPWLEMGNTIDDPTNFTERLFHYTLDLDLGIQSYIFEGSNKKLNIINFDKLSDEDKMIYRFFCNIIFNRNYEIQLNEENKKRLKENTEFYYKYFKQIQQHLGVKKNNN